jgi:ribosome-binding protein aMBF1 (putative translation factor)
VAIRSVARSAARPMLHESTGERIQRLRHARGWSQRQLAERAGVSSLTVSRAEQGAEVYAWGLFALADALDTCACALWEGSCPS